MLDQDNQSTPLEVEPIGPEIARGPYPEALERTIAGFQIHLNERRAGEAAETLRRMFDRAKRWAQEKVD